jgi:hypothetical protein
VHRVRVLTIVWAVLTVGALALVTTGRTTPMYTARAGRTCDNCHVTPNNWVDPKLSERKCTLSCQGCHVDPAGGGMRTVSGRYYGRATLPMIAYSPRPTSDWDNNAPYVGRRDRATSYTHNIPMGPSDFPQTFAYADSINDRWAWGSPAGTPAKYGFWQGRYESLRADPLFRVGLDIRLASLISGTWLAFPMQADISSVLHPVRHVTLFANVGARGRTSGYSDTFSDDHSPYFREAFLMFHEAPYQAYVKAGRFVPAFGLRLDDHTSRIRREFELDGALPESRVTGVEIGASPNYPVINVSYFGMTSRTRPPDSWDIFDVDDGRGAAANLGWRDMGWSLGGSGLWRSRPLDEGGDTTTYGVWGSFNPWFYWRSVPLTWQGEVDFGTFQRASGLESDKMAAYAELDWLAWNGVNFLVAWDWADPDREVIDDESHRFQAGVQLLVVPGATLDGRVRALIPAAGEGAGSDFFLQLHLWL